MPELGGSSPDRLLDVSGMQERVQRHTVEQTLAPVAALDAPVPPSVHQLVLEIVDMNLRSGVQVIDVPKIIVEDPIPQRAVLRVPQLVEQVVDVPLPRRVTLAGGRDVAGQAWSRAWVRRGSFGGSWAHDKPS